MQIAEHYWGEPKMKRNGHEKPPWHEKESVIKTGTITRSKGKQDEYVGWGGPSFLRGGVGGMGLREGGREEEEREGM